MVKAKSKFTDDRDTQGRALPGVHECPESIGQSRRCLARCAAPVREIVPLEFFHPILNFVPEAR
jgi:hypothetical protein